MTAFDFTGARVPVTGASRGIAAADITGQTLNVGRRELTA